jgi:uncharacterized protein (DUF2062 family)
MPKRFIRRFLPADHHIRDHKHLRIFGKLLHDPNLWHLNRYSVAGAFGVGLFCAFLPMPFEMVAAGLGAIVLRVNLPISVALVWLSNPFTWVPLYGAGYLLGARLLGLPPVNFHDITLEWLLKQFGPLWLGNVLLGLAVAGLSYVVVRGLWRMKVAADWQRRRKLRNRKTAAFARDPAEPPGGDLG